ncbi:Hs1pro-1_C domain-containing protein/Hs1pro-1_N domain-containing protein [Cephalotus follicularis]|uniref:Hs1pro-1_C domain-containing protein/Hs1pro-1_N domain-containing protein n=1 Tax=Cephalotus follicularis TaxID=3775 RepID=A0A1Q3AML6_CEPFO|nr:Hs1pro-1_C domain-containing protein/Hs1pro-1_N domain-containing protein [Cephalotus follicularis]
MVDLDWKVHMASSPDMQKKSPKITNKLQVSIPASLRVNTNNNTSSPLSSSSSSACSAYEQYLRLPELRKLWTSTDFPDWQNESVLKPALQALEITFRFVSIVLSDSRPYVNRLQWKRRLESVTVSQIELIALLCEDEEGDDAARGTAPIVDLTSSNGVLSRDGSSAEVWKIPGETAVVNRTSEASLLPRLASWQKSEDFAQKILYAIECEMRRCSFTLGIGEPNLAGKPNLDYDAVCKPNEIHALKKNPYDHIENSENQMLYTTHQILESWIYTAKQLLKRINERIESKKFAMASSDCYILERIWKLLEEIEDIHLSMDPDDFLHLKSKLLIRSLDDQSDAFCFRSRSLVEITRMCKNLKHSVPLILEVEVDPKGGPRIQEAAMRLYGGKKEPEKIHVIEGMQAIESALKRFFFAYKQVLVIVMGSLEAKGNRVVVSNESCDSLSQIFLEPTYYPSLDAAKTFLGEYWSREQQVLQHRNKLT